MKRWFRPIAYSAILILVAMAIFGRPSARNADAVVLSTRVAHRAMAPAGSGETKSAFTLHARRDEALAATLFHASAPALTRDVAPAAAPATPEPPADLKILGWMLSDTMPTVFVTYGNENYTLSPTQSVNGVYRFDEIGGGQAVFTYLPTGEVRQYAVSDPALSE